MISLYVAATATAAGSSWWGRHGAHVVLLAVPTTVLGGIAVVSDVRTRLLGRRPTGDSSRGLTPD